MVTKVYTDFTVLPMNQVIDYADGCKIPNAPDMMDHLTGAGRIYEANDETTRLMI